MTDKQIIIDGCDVSRCSELYNGCCCDNGSFNCSDQPNCEFKLEKRGYKIEQITEFTPREELLETITHLRVLNAELESYNEQLKKGLNIENKTNKILIEQLKAKEQECERLKRELMQYEKDVKDLNYFAIKLKQTLAEIKEIIVEFSKQDIITFPDFKAEKNYEFIQKQCGEPILQILQKISEVEQ